MSFKCVSLTLRKNSLRDYSIRGFAIAVGLLTAQLVAPNARLLAEDSTSDGGWQAGETERPRPLAKIDSNTLQISLEQESESNFVVTVDLEAASVSDRFRPQVFTVAKPARLVIDLPGVQSSNGAATPDSSDVVTGLRLGAHAEKARLVVDLSSSEVPTYRVKREGNILSVRFSVDDGAVPPEFEEGEEEASAEPKVVSIKDRGKNAAEQASEPSKTSTKPAIAPVEAGPVEAAPAETGPSENGRVETGPVETGPVETAPVESTVLAANHGQPVAPEPVEVEKPTAASAEVVPVPTDGKTVVRGIYYQTTSNSQVPAVVFDASGLATYTLNKQKPDVYELVLKNTSLAGRHLTLPQFPPDSFQGFNVIVARQQGSDVVIKVYVEENVKLFPFIAKQQLWLKASR